MDKAKVYFCKDITSENLIKVYDALGINRRSWGKRIFKSKFNRTISEKIKWNYY